jgi:hypothetical protein
MFVHPQRGRGGQIAPGAVARDGDPRWVGADLGRVLGRLVGRGDANFPNFEGRGQVGPLAIGQGGNATYAPDRLSISDDILAGQGATRGPLSLHQRDLSPAPDNFTLNVMPLNEALTEADIAQVRDAYIAAQADLQVMG